MVTEESRVHEQGKILVVDDEPVVGDVLRTLLARDGHQVYAAGDAAEGRRLLEEESGWHAVLLDVMLPDADGLAVLRWIRESAPDIAVVLITAYGTVENAVAAMKSGAFHYLTKPFQNDDVRHLVKQAVLTTRLSLWTGNPSLICSKAAFLICNVERRRVCLQGHGFGKAAIVLQGSQERIFIEIIYSVSPHDNAVCYDRCAVQVDDLSACIVI